MRVFFNGVTDVERTFRFDIAHVRTLSERNTVHYIIRFIINQFELDMFLVASHHFACSIIIDVMSAENGFRVVGTERIKLFQVVEEFGRNIPEVDFSINFDDGTGLFRQDMP